MKKKNIMIGILAAILLVAFDQFSKSLAVKHLMNRSPIVLIDGVFQLFYLENKGAAFGMFQGRRVLFLLITLIIMVLVAYVYYKISSYPKYRLLRITLILLTAGAVGNMIDRVANGYVVDFFYFNLINFPIFNVADCYVTIAAAALFFLILFYYKDDDFEFLLSGKKKKEVL